MREIFQKTTLLAFKRNKNLQEIIGGHTIKNVKVFNTYLESRKEKREPCNTNRHHYVASRSLILVQSKVTKPSNYTLYFTSSTVKANSLFT